MLRDRAITKKSFTTYITPPADLYETQDSYMIFLDMPGVSKDDLNVKVIDNRLIVQGKFGIEKPRTARFCSMRLRRVNIAGSLYCPVMLTGTR
jgi:HSP20 family molecular chaperone IbpA